MRNSYQPLFRRPPGNAQAPVDPRRLRLRMVQEQIEARGLTDAAILEAMAAVPRHLFVPDAFKSHAYDDSPVPIGFGQTISQPYVVAIMTRNLMIQKGMRVLEIGAGSGYQAAVLATLGCSVIAVERIGELFMRTRTLLQKLGYRSIHLHKGDGTLGMPMSAPFERILVSAGGPQIPPPLLAQLGEKGIMLIPVGERPRTQRLIRIKKINGSLFREDMGPAAFVDLVGDHGWLK